MGAILSPGKRTVSSALNILGIGQHGDFAVYHHVLNRAQTATEPGAVAAGGRALGSSTEPLVFLTRLERRWGRKIGPRGGIGIAVKDDQVVMMDCNG